jgi:predicted nucleic acid-binding protein
LTDVFRTKFGWREERVQTTLKTIVRLAGTGLVVPSVSVHAVAADDDDNRILECAAAGKADLIVTNDHHLLDLKAWSGIAIVATVGFRRMLGLK